MRVNEICSCWRGTSFAGCATYLTGLKRDLVEPNRASWLIWSAATAVEASTYAAVNDGLQRWVFMFATVACVAITIAWRRPPPDLPDAHRSDLHRLA